MNTPILTQLASVSPTPPTPSRGDADEPGTRESFGQVMARVGGEAKPRTEATHAKRDEAKRDAGRSDTGAAEKAEAADRPARTPASAETSDAEDEAPDAIASPAKAKASHASDGDGEAVEDDAASASQLIDALHLPAANPLVAAVGTDAVSAEATTLDDVSAQSNPAAIASVQTAAPESGEPPAAESAVALTASSARALDESAAKVAQPREAEAKTIDTPPQAAVRQPNAATAEQQVARDAAALNDAAAEPAERAPAMQPNLLAEARKALRDENRSPPMDKASPPRAPIAEALAALGAKQAEGASASAKGSANEHNFEQLLASRALAAPRAEPATQAVPFANLLAPQPTTSPAAVIATPVDQAGFAQDFGNRVLLLATGHVKSAELALTPPDLGPVRVNIEVRGQDASISFVASAAATRAALEDALPKLREMFAQQGLNLLDASVGAQVGQQGHRAYGRPQAVRGAGRNDGETPLAVDAVAGIRPAGSGRPVRLIDVIA